MNHEGMTTTICADFYSDWIKHMKDQLTSSGYESKPEDSPDETGLKFFNTLRSRIPIKPRKILTSKEFSCPLDLQDGLNLLKGKIEKGEDANPHLGMRISKNDKRLLNASYDDGLLNDWGIHHFHLGPALEPRRFKQRFIKRTDSVVFAKVTDDVFYLVNVMKHGNWTNRQLLEIIHSNWPDSISRHRSGSWNIEYNPKDEEIKKLRRGVAYAIRLSDGTVYHSIGGGYATSGVSIDVIDRRDYYATRVRQIEQHLRENIEELIPECRQQRSGSYSQLKFTLKVFDEYFLAVEDNLKKAFQYELK
jgi:hypothetical protein